MTNNKRPESDIAKTKRTNYNIRARKQKLKFFFFFLSDFQWPMLPRAIYK